MNTIYKMNTEETNSLTDHLKETIVLKECLCRVSNCQFIEFHASEIHFGGCLWPSSGRRGLKSRETSLKMAAHRGSETEEKDPKVGGRQMLPAGRV